MSSLTTRPGRLATRPRRCRSSVHPDSRRTARNLADAALSTALGVFPYAISLMLRVSMNARCNTRIQLPGALRDESPWCSFRHLRDRRLPRERGRCDLHAMRRETFGIEQRRSQLFDPQLTAFLVLISFLWHAVELKRLALLVEAVISIVDFVEHLGRVIDQHLASISRHA
ncbi:MAG: hypothetical protein JWL96_2278 [Sphingomonas bacterium]|nr:hypothetical protein [Sphingomonas bacterium]